MYPNEATDRVKTNGDYRMRIDESEEKRGALSSI